MTDPRLPPAEGGMQIGGYELVRRIGRGGMAEVWVARKLGRARQQRYVAIKLMAANLAGQERFTRMFRAEADLAAMLTHANIVQVFDEGEENGRAYLVMEWVDGINLVKLGAVMTLCEPELRDRIAAYVVGQLLHALAYAHSITTHDGHPLGIVHRDVTPQNVLISNHGDVKLTDFGVARFAFDESSGAHVKGKVRYMSPEQLSGKTREPTLDLYAAGAILHELCDGQKFRGDIDQQVMWRDILAGKIPPMSRPLPPELDAVRLGLLEPDPTKRMQTAEEAIERLRLWSGYGEMKLELARLCTTMTGVTRPRTGPGLVNAPMQKQESSVAPTSRRDNPDLALAPTERAAAAGAPAARATSAYGEPMAEPVGPTIALTPGAATGGHAKGDTVLLPRSGLPESVAMQSNESWREATTATSLVAPGATEQDLRPAGHAEALPRFPWLLVIFGAVAAIAIGSVGAWIVLGGARSNEDAVAERADAPAETPVEPASEPKPAEPEPEPESEPDGLIIGAEKSDPAKADAEPEDTDAPAKEDDAAEVQPSAEDEDEEARTSAEDPNADPQGSASRSGASSRAGSKPRQPTSKATVPVHVRLEGLPSAELKIGKRKIQASPYFDGLLPVGRHRVSWRRNASDAWHSAGSFNFVEGAEYVVRVSSNGPRLETM